MRAVNSLMVALMFYSCRLNKPCLPCDGSIECRRPWHGMEAFISHFHRRYNHADDNHAPPLTSSIKSRLLDWLKSARPKGLMKQMAFIKSSGYACGEQSGAYHPWLRCKCRRWACFGIIDDDDALANAHETMTMRASRYCGEEAKENARMLLGPPK